MKGRILVADNDPDYRKALIKTLFLDGYEVFGASNPSEAEETIKKELIHLAILDKRLNDDNDRNDESGIELAQRIDSTICKILLTRYPEVKNVKKVRKPSIEGEEIAFDFIEKENGYEAIKSAIKTAFGQKIKINFDLKVELADKLPSCAIINYLKDEKAFEFLLDEIFIKGTETKEEREKMGEELGEVFKKLFYSAEKITILPFSSRGYSKTGVVLVEPGRVDEGIFALRIVKFGPRRDIERESKNYKNL